MPRFFTETITKDQLAEKIFNAISKVVEDYNADKDEIQYYIERAGLEKDDYTNLVQIWYIGSYALQAAIIEKDLSKVEFDTENFDCDPSDWPQAGFHTLDNGLTYLGIVTHGDWETPLFVIIYWDGTKLRGYLPKEGNPWNTDIKMAYGNNEGEVDDNNAQKRFGCDSDYIKMDMDKIIQDIERRIKKK